MTEQNPQRNTASESVTTNVASGIDLAHEELVPFRDVPNLLPRLRRGRKPHVGSIYRWSDRGLKGVKLEYLQVAGMRCTSVQALQRFFERLTHPNRPALTRSFAKRQREIKGATEEVKRLLYGTGRRRGKASEQK
ncbi:MAG TPA: DUF1580 domain-containing protein [Tepidisphaeraceae bacterium]|jgi:hypothetical protein